MPEDKSNKQQNQATHSFSLTTKTFPQIWSFAVNRFGVIKKHVSVQLRLAGR